jgi:CBS domain-containing protein
VTEDEGAELTPWGVVSDLDLLGAAHEGAEELTARQVSRTPAVMVAPGDPLARAAHLMRATDTSHVIVIAEDSRPIGVVSTLDIAGALAWGEG